MTATKTPPHVSLLVAYRDRVAHLRTLLERLSAEESVLSGMLELVLVEANERPSVQWISEIAWVRYVYEPDDGPFRLARLRNRAAELASGSFLVPFDVDLIPSDGVLKRHHTIASTSPHILVGGYRLQLPEDYIANAQSSGSLNTFSTKPATCQLCVEDNQTALFKYLVDGERFGVCVHIPRDLFWSVGGYDEHFVGWGAEDADLLERLCLQSNRSLARCYDLLYFHQAHSPTPKWNDDSLTDANRHHYYAKRRERERKGGSSG